MSTPLHTEIKGLAGANPAAYLSIDLIQSLTIARILVAIKNITGVEIPAGQLVLSASLDSATFVPTPIGASRFVKRINPPSLPNEILLSLNSDLTVIVKVFVKGAVAKVVSTVTVVVKDIMILGSYANNIITFEGMECAPIPTVTRTPNADAILKAAGIDPVEASRVEGLIAYSSVNSSLAANLAQRKEVSLSEIFPAFDFGTSAKLVPLRAGRALGIIPSQFTRVEAAACKCAQGPDLPVSGSTNTIVAPANAKVGSSLGGVAIGGPLAQNIDPLKDLGRRYVGDGDAGVYLPRTAYTGLASTVMPAIAIHASDNGFIGFDAYATVGFYGLNVALDAPRGGIVVSVNMQISVQATCTLDMGCGLRLPIGYAIINPVAGSNAHLSMGFYPSVDQSGAVKLKGILQTVDMGQYVAVILGIGTALKIIGVTAWIGFLIDVVLSAVVSYKLPYVLTDEVKKYLGQNEWTLLNLGDLLRNTYGPGAYGAPYDVDNDTILASVSSQR